MNNQPFLSTQQFYPLQTDKDPSEHLVDNLEI